MGSPRKSKKKYKKPLVIWDENLIAEHRKILKEYGLKNKKEIWRTDGILKRLRDQAKRLIATESEQAEKEKAQLINKLVRLGIIKPGSKLNDVLNLTLEDLLERRLQTMVFKKNLAKSVKQARQFIVHGHISINEEKINVPSYLVQVSEEDKISFNPASKLSNHQHPERIKERSRREKRETEQKVDETDIFIEGTVEEVIKIKDESLEEIREEAENKLPEEDITREIEDKPAGKAK